MGDFWSDLFNTDKWGKAINASAHGDNANGINGVNGPMAALSGDSNNPLHALGLTHGVVDPAAPGATVDTSKADADRARMQAMIAQLQQQAATGDGSWQQTLATGTQAARDSAQAIGQSQHGIGGMQAERRNIGNAQSAATQQSAGEANTLRAQSQTGAQDQLSALLGSEGDTDASQAAATAAAAQGARELNASLNTAAKQGMAGTVKGAAEAVAALSDGGRVPGNPKTFGDDEANDTVPAWLSPGEIVIPRSHSGSPEAAADFVRAVQARKGGPPPNAHKFADGGQAGPGNGLDSNGLSYKATGLFDNNDIQNPTVQNGGLLDTTNFDANRTAQLQNANLLEARANGAGPSVAPQQIRNAQDAGIAAAMNASPRGATSGSDVLMHTVGSLGGAGANAAQVSTKEQQAGQQAFAHAVMAQRARDNAFAVAQQQAAFRNTQLNSGLDLASQAQMKGLLGAAGTAAVAAASAGGPSAGPGAPPPTPADDPSMWDNPYSSEFGGSMDSPSNLSSPEDRAHGGYIGHYASGGEVARRNKLQALFGGQGYFNGGGVDTYLGSIDGPTDALPARMDAGPQVAPIGPVYDPVALAATPAPPYVAPDSSAAYAAKLQDDARHGIFPTQGAQAAQSHFGALENMEKDKATQAGMLEIGARPKGSPPPAVAEVSPVAAPVAPQAGGFRVPTIDSKETDAATLAAMGANASKAQVEGDLAKNLATAEGERQKQLAANALEQKQMADRAGAESREMMAKIQAASDEMKNTDMTVDPGRYWASRSTGQKITGIIGLALGTLGAGPDGVNRAAGMLNQAIDRDIDAQKSEHDLRLRKGQQAVAAATSMYGLHHQTLQDDIAARAAAKATADEIAASQVKQITSAAGGPMASAVAQQLNAKLLEDAAKNHQEAGQKTYENRIKQQLANAESTKAAAVAATKGAPAVPLTGGIQALDRYEAAWKKGGGLTGGITKHVPGTDAKALEDLAGADSVAIATQLNGGKNPKRAFVDKVQEDLLGHPGESIESGNRKHAELRRMLQEANSKAGVSADMSPE